MRKSILIVCLLMMTALYGCGPGASSHAVEAASASAEQSATQIVEFKGVRLQIPLTWNEVEVDKGSIEAAAFWQYEGKEDFGKHGSVVAYSELFETYGNTNTQMPDPANPDQQQAKRYLDLGMKALDERIFMETIAKASLGNDASLVDQSSFRLEERDGHALWILDMDFSGGKMVGYGVPLDDRMVAIFATANAKELSVEQKAIFESLTVDEETDELIFEMAQKIEGKSQDDAVAVIASFGEIPHSSDSGATGYKSDNSSRSNGKDTATTDSQKSDDTYFEMDDGDVIRIGDDGSITQYNDLGITTFNEDGTKEWTDGWGTVVRDENGDGEPDYVSYDSGETWQRVKD